MPMFPDATALLFLDYISSTVDDVSLHTAYSASGANEVTGGSPAYARQTPTWQTTGREVNNNGALTFDVPATTVRWVGLWEASTFRGMVPIGSTEQHVAYSRASSDEFIVGPTCGYAGDTALVVTKLASDALPAGITEGNVYFPVNITVDEEIRFQLSTTVGGSAVTFTGDVKVIISDIVPVVFAGQDECILTDEQLKVAVW